MDVGQKCGAPGDSFQRCCTVLHGMGRARCRVLHGLLLPSGADECMGALISEHRVGMVLCGWMHVASSGMVWRVCAQRPSMTVTLCGVALR